MPYVKPFLRQNKELINKRSPFQFYHKYYTVFDPDCNLAGTKVTFRLQPWSLPVRSEAALAKPEEAQGLTFFNGHSENSYIRMHLNAIYVCAGILQQLLFCIISPLFSFHLC